MTKGQFVVLTITSVLLLLLFVSQIVLAEDNKKNNRALLQANTVIAASQRMEPELKQLALRIATAAEKEKDLNDLLTKYNLKVTLNNKQTQQTQANSN